MERVRSLPLDEPNAGIPIFRFRDRSPSRFELDGLARGREIDFYFGIGKLGLRAFVFGGSIFAAAVVVVVVTGRCRL